MVRIPRLIAAVVLSALTTSGCERGTSPHGAVRGKARIVHGPSSTEGSVASRAARATSAAAPANGYWAITPNEAKVTLERLVFRRRTGAEGVEVGELSGCIVSYTFAGASLSQILDCPFTMAPGTFNSIDLAISPTFSVLIDDAVNNIYTDGSAGGLTTTRPAGGPVFSNFTIEFPYPSMTLGTPLSEPLVVDAESPPTITLVADLIHTVFITVSNGVPVFNTTLPVPAVQIGISVTGVGRAEYYTAAATTANVRMPGQTDNDVNSVRVSYANPPQPSTLFSPLAGQAWAVNPANAPINSDAGLKAGGYLGLDASGVLCWAMPIDQTYAGYKALWKMQTVTTLGAATTLIGQTVTSAPAPTSGDTYASGCPAMNSPTQQITVYLVAK